MWPPECLRAPSTTRVDKSQHLIQSEKVMFSCGICQDVIDLCVLFWLIARVFPPPSQSYYCLLKVNVGRGDEEKLRQYLVCFLSIGKEGLDLYPLSYVYMYLCVCLPHIATD